MTMLFRAGVTAVALLAALPAVAQTGRHGPGGPCERDMQHRPRPFAGMSVAGRRAVTNALHPRDNSDHVDRERVGAARDRMLAVLDAPRLDPVALKRAMDAERDAANTMHARRQAGVLRALQGLNAADRRAFVADARAMRGRFEQMDKRMKGRGTDDGPPDCGPPMM